MKIDAIEVYIDEICNFAAPGRTRFDGFLDRWGQTLAWLMRKVNP